MPASRPLAKREHIQPHADLHLRGKLARGAPEAPSPELASGIPGRRAAGEHPRGSSAGLGSDDPKGGADSSHKQTAIVSPHPLHCVRPSPPPNAPRSVGRPR